jgi:hypothetical protein
LRQEPSILEPAARERILDAARRAGAAAHARVTSHVKARRAARVRIISAGAVLLVLVAAVVYQTMWPAQLSAAVRFEVRLAEEEPQAGLTVVRAGTGGRFVYLHPGAIVDNDDIAQAWVSGGAGDGRFGVAIQFLPRGAEKMREATSGHVGRPPAELLDGTVVMAPTVRSPIGDTATITGDFTKADAERIAAGVVP